ncbi:MAG TPA: solute carrier family 23 protein [Patescibacteria group bacterium]|nr:solute carrier family 23 protein [Patescibacteria group bacterium]
MADGKVKKPSGITYGADDKPPLSVLIPLVFQQIVILSVDLLFPVLIVASLGGPTELAQSLVSLMMITMGIGTIMQSCNKGPIGSGYFCAQETNALFFPVSVLAVKSGGLHLMLGMTVVAGVAQALFSRVVHKLRVLFPVEITGLIILMLPISLIKYSFFSFVGSGKAVDAQESLIAFVTLGVIMLMHVWGKGWVRQYSVVFGILSGFAASYFTGVLTADQLNKVTAAPLVAFPGISHVGWSFSPDLLIPFLVVAFCSSIKTLGNITACQKVNDANWIRPDMKSIGGGLLAEGLSTVVSGLCGTMGQTTSSCSMGLAIATGALSRTIGYCVGIAFILLAFLPKISSVFAIMPEPVMAAILMLGIIFVISNGMQICTSRMLDARRSFVLGLPFTLGLAVEMFPGFSASFPPYLQPLFQSSLAAAAVTAILLNLLFRIGVAKHHVVDWTPGTVTSEEIADFMEANGSAWGARREIITRVAAVVNEFMESAAGLNLARGTVQVDASFDEFNLNVDIRYEGTLMDFPAVKPTETELLQDDAAFTRLSGFLIKKQVDMIRTSVDQEKCSIHFHFDH